jgi:hypothetical protein
MKNEKERKEKKETGSILILIPSRQQQPLDQTDSSSFFVFLVFRVWCRCVLVAVWVQVCVFQQRTQRQAFRSLRHGCADRRKDRREQPPLHVGGRKVWGESLLTPEVFLFVFGLFFCFVCVVFVFFLLL